MKAVRRMVVGTVVLVVVGWWLVWGVGYLLRPRPVEPPPPPEPRLIGTWVSDADANIEELRRTRPITSAEEKKFRETLFQTRVTYTDEVVTTEVAGERVPPEAYRVVRRDEDGVVIRYYFEGSKQEEEFHIRFLGPDRYRLDAPQFGLTELFRRVP